MPEYFTSGASCGYGDHSCEPALRAILTSVGGPRGSTPMHVEVDIEPHQRKEISIGVVSRSHEGGNTSYEQC